MASSVQGECCSRPLAATQKTAASAVAKAVAEALPESEACISRGGGAGNLVTGVIWPAAPASANQSISVAVCSLNVTRRRRRLSRLVSYAVGNVGVLRAVRATFRPVLRAVRATFRPVLRAVRATFRPVLRAVLAVLRAVRAVLRPVLRTVRATLRPVLRTVRAVLRAVRFVVAIVFLPALSSNSFTFCRLCRRTWQVNYFLLGGRG